MIQRFEFMFGEPESYVIKSLRQVVNGKIDSKTLKLIDYRNEFNKPSGIIIFVLGGITLEESCEIQKINKMNDRINVIAGGSKILSTDR